MSRTPLCDVIFAVDIDEINVSAYVGDENEFILKGKGIRLVFSSPKRHDIIQVSHFQDLANRRQSKPFEQLLKIVVQFLLVKEACDREAFQGHF